MSIQLRTRKFTVKEYARMGEAGVFDDGERVELIEGEIVTLSPQNPQHARIIEELSALMFQSFASTHRILVQLPLTLGAYSEPEPDLALVRRGLPDGERHPEVADLIIEVSRSTLSKDRRTKGALYAKYGQPEYWILNTKKMRLEVRRQPLALADGFGYKDLLVLTPGQTIAPLFAPEQVFEVSRLLGA
ncbi:MAG: Uma2 family endonuclease [Candidatus Eremiobacteraeota bacterium]|nr:Uma2 family endonuclease [Candidatus Eremiobacteraeota bacterium]MCW5867616.1 Uma2 family endonuclease [Candidatus Eremiobacteraeota bacterium]